MPTTSRHRSGCSRCAMSSSHRSPCRRQGRGRLRLTTARATARSCGPATDVHAKRHDAVDQVIAGRDRVEHRPHRADLLVTWGSVARSDMSEMNVSSSPCSSRTRQFSLAASDPDRVSFWIIGCFSARRPRGWLLVAWVAIVFVFGTGARAGTGSAAGVPTTSVSHPARVRGPDVRLRSSPLANRVDRRQRRGPLTALVLLGPSRYLYLQSFDPVRPDLRLRQVPSSSTTSPGSTSRGRS